MTNNLSVLWGNRIKRLRKDLGLSQRAFAARAEIDPGYYARIENGQLGGRGVGDEIRMRIAQVAGRRVEEIFSYPDTTQDPPCPSAANAAERGSSPTPATAAATPSSARSAAAPAPSDREGSHDND